MTRPPAIRRAEWSGQRRRRSTRWLPLALVTIALAGCAPAEPDGEAQTARGEELYQAHCVECHGGATGGAMTDIPPRHNAEGHTWHHGDCELVDMVLDGMPERPGQPTSRSAARCDAPWTPGVTRGRTRRVGANGCPARPGASARTPQRHMDTRHQRRDCRPHRSAQEDRGGAGNPRAPDRTSLTCDAPRSRRAPLARHR